jgi:hypothetical protein
MVSGMNTTLYQQVEAYYGAKRGWKRAFCRAMGFTPQWLHYLKVTGKWPAEREAQALALISKPK